VAVGDVGFEEGFALGVVSEAFVEGEGVGLGVQPVGLGWDGAVDMGEQGFADVLAACGLEDGDAGDFGGGAVVFHKDAGGADGRAV